MRHTEKFVLIHGAVLFGLGVALAMFNPDYYHNVFSAEGGIMEWLTVLALATVSTVTAKRLMVGFRRFSRIQRLVLVSLALLAAFGAGEELSWGQRLFNTSVPEFFRKHNAQVETNIHNLVVAGANVNKVIFAKGLLIVFCLYLGVLTPLYSRSKRVRCMVDACAVPVPKSYQIAGYVLIILTVEGLLNMLPFEVPRRGELTEFAVPVLVALNIFYPRNFTVFEIADE